MMFGIWFIGFLLTICGRGLYLGMNSHLVCNHYDQYDIKYRGRKLTDTYLDTEKVAFFCLITAIMAFTWMLSAPGVAMYLIGKRVSKKNV